PADGKVRSAGLGAAIERIGGDGAYSGTEEPSVLYGRDGAFAIDNPVTNTPGILAARTGYGSNGCTQCGRRDGSLTFTGNQRLGGNELTEVGEVTAEEVNAETVTTSGRLRTNEYLKIGGVAVEGAA